jgi:uncharacterized protein
MILPTAAVPPVVHSSPGRLRVHLPDPEGDVVARLRLLSGVSCADASRWTGNILILFDPKQTSEKALLDELRAIIATPAASAPPAAMTAVVANDPLPPPAVSEAYLTGAWGRLYNLLGWSSVGMAFVGAATPGIPTVPFALLAGYFFVRSSPAANEWLQHSKLLGPIMRNWEEHRGVTRSLKVTAFALMGAGLAFSVLAGLPAAVLASIVVLELIGILVVARLPVVELAPANEALPA